MAERTTIHGSSHYGGDLHVDYDAGNNRVYLHMSSGGFSHCLSLGESDARKMAEALMKAAFKIEANTPQPPEVGAA